jgi:hypothetical protein
MAETKARKKFSDLSQRVRMNYTDEQIFSIFKQSEKYTFERHLAILEKV